MTSLNSNSFEPLMPQILSLTESMVSIETPTEDHLAINSLVDLVEEEAVRIGGVVRRVPQSEAGEHLVAQWGSGAGGVLLLTHLDTVHPRGSLALNPTRRQENRLYGPGVLDMKASVALALVVIEALQGLAPNPGRRIRLLCTSDEETGSLTSRSLIEQLAGESELVLCLEAALPDGAVKTRRKGIGAFVVETRGKAAHAGVSPEDGVNAIAEMAHQVQNLQRINELHPGTSANPGVVEGGSRANVVPDWCQLKLDIRVESAEAARQVDAYLQSLRPKLEGAELRISGGWNRPPMPRTSAIARAYERAHALAQELDFDLKEGSSGGGSDANFVAPLGVPLLDGLGPVGSGAHTSNEFIELDSLPARAALLAGLISQPL